MLRLSKYGYVVLLLLAAGCTITGRMNRCQINAGLHYKPQPPVRHSGAAKDTTVQRQRVEYTDCEGNKSLLMAQPGAGEESMMAPIAMEEVVVTAKAKAASRTLPERNGRIRIDFMITLPKLLLGTCQSITVTPMLHNRGMKIPLESLIIRGELFSKVQERNCWQFEQYCTLFKPGLLQKERAFQRFVKNPYPQGARLDSILENRNSLSYCYSQKVETRETDQTVSITLEGRVAALDRSSYRLPLSDTLRYHISSMLSFVDTTTKYVTQVIEKYVVVKDRNCLNFPANRTEIVDSLGDNKAQLARIEGLMEQIVHQKEFYIDSITLTASASPEGNFRHNDNLARGRAFALRDYLAGKFKAGGIDQLPAVRWRGEDWEELAKRVEASEKMENRFYILMRIKAAKADPDADWDGVEEGIQKDYPQDYAVMLEELYPKLRAVTFKYDLRRVGMVKDTVCTTAPDTLYARGYGLLRDRRYAEALPLLDPYRDRNTAICLLSLGFDRQALDLLRTFPQAAVTEYLKAIACARLGRKEEGRQYFETACDLDEKLRFRGELDPEVNQLTIDNQ